MSEADRSREQAARAVRVEMALEGLMRVLERHAHLIPLDDERDRSDVERARAVVDALQAAEAALLARTQPPA